MVMLKERIQEDMKSAMRAQDKKRLGIVRLILAAVKQYEVDTRNTADDAQLISILDKMLKQRRESLQQYEQAKRQDLAEQEQYEITVIQEFMPVGLSEAEINQLIDAAFNAAQAKTMQDMGKVMAILKPQLQGRADMAAVSAKIKQRLG